MKEVVLFWLNTVSKIGLGVVIVSTLFLFTNLTTDLYEPAKFLVLLVFTGILLILTALKYNLAGKVSLIRTPLDIPLLLLLIVAIVSTVFSGSPYVSLLGNSPTVHGSLVAIITYVLFYYLLVNNLRSLREIRFVIYVLVVSGTALSIISLLAYTGMKLLPDPWSHSVNFTPTGSSFSTTAILALLLPFLVIELLTGTKILLRGLSAVFLALFGVTIALTGVPSVYVASLLGVALTLAVIRPKLGINTKSLLFLAVPIAIVLLVSLLSFIPPVAGVNNPFYNQAKSFPREIQLDFPISWKVSVSSFRDSPFWGSGPATHLFDFTTYKPIEFNATRYWNIRFDSAFNEYFGVLATLGGVGLIALLTLTALFISTSYRTLLRAKAEGVHLTPASKLALGLAVAGIGFFIVLALHASTLVVWVIGLIILASYMAVNALTMETSPDQAWRRESGFKQMFLRMAATVTPTGTSSEEVRIDALPSIILVIAVALTGFSFFFAGKFALADYQHRQALNAVAQNQGVLAYNALVEAEKLNPVNDLYRSDLAQTNFALANAIAIAKGPTEASPSGSLTDEDRQNIQVLLQQAINEGRQAVALNPRNPVNWEILGNIYRQISGVAENALLFALDAYGRAIMADPLNPMLRLSVGGTYYAIQNYDLAIRFFTDAINLKPDFANGYFNLAVALRDKGDLQSAVLAAERVVALVDPASTDYQVATDFLNDLKSRTQTAEAETELTAPTAQDSGPLQQQDLPKVIDLPQPENIATPPAVKKPDEEEESSE